MYHSQQEGKQVSCHIKTHFPIASLLHASYCDNHQGHNNDKQEHMASVLMGLTAALGVKRYHISKHNHQIIISKCGNALKENNWVLTYSNRELWKGFGLGAQGRHF